MTIFLSGATGFIGGHIRAALLLHGHAVTSLVRPGSTLPSALNSRIVEGQWTRPAEWQQFVAGHEAVINTVGIIRERGASFKAVHTVAACALFEAAAKGGARKIVQISALGADAGARSRYHRSKRAADRFLAKLGVPYVILRPSIVYGPGDHSMSFFAHLAALPLTPVPGDGRFCLQPLNVADVVRAVVQSVERDDLQAATVDAGGGRALSFNDLLDVLARRQGKLQARKVHIPWTVMRLVAAATDALGGRGPITREELMMLRRGSCTSNSPFIACFGFQPASFPDDAG